MPKSANHTPDTPTHEELPPLGGSWTTLYAIVLSVLAALVVAFYVFTRAFR